MPLALPILLVAAIAGYLLLRHSEGGDTSPGVPPQPGSDRPVTGAFQNAADGVTATSPATSAPIAPRKPITLSIHRQDLGSVAQNPQFTTAAERAYLLAHAPAGEIPHMVMQEGSTRIVGGHVQKQVKFVRPGVGGSDTRWANVS